MCHPELNEDNLNLQIEFDQAAQNMNSLKAFFYVYKM